ncbi:glycosyltransferase family 8 protein [Liquorilactobacillus capillatus]|uniref:Glycosyl transferase family protein n=1 Tax=Liquorilactobacillus capillatus DSM 19910 TaxID=1423731 RepID=A0A0R1M3J5_9LACO|nr:glycosyltransferase [Liquorilactobacillus capillatus]KRL02604.1 hypothetical protein FC81_GL000641 [Liquorilactobacillus capillatus DSM 19910]
MNVLYTLNSGFEAQLIVSVLSLIRHTTINLNIFIVFDNINKETKEWLENLENNRIKIKILKSPKISERLIPDRGSKCQYYRLYVTEIFADLPNIKRVLYLDCDTLITNNDVEKMFYADMNGYALAGTIDPWGPAYKSLFKLKRDSNMFNDGVLLIDINCWKKKNYDKKIEKIIMNKKSFIQADQGILNELAQGNFKILEPKFNVITSYFELKYKELLCYRKPIGFYSQTDINKAIDNPSIIHFTSTFLNNRPWVKESIHPYKEEWLEYLKDENIYVKINVNMSNKKNFLKVIFQKMPRKIAIIIFGCLQAYVRPLILKIKAIF